MHKPSLSPLLLTCLYLLSVPAHAQQTGQPQPRPTLSPSGSPVNPAVVRKAECQKFRQVFSQSNGVVGIVPRPATSSQLARNRRFANHYGRLATTLEQMRFTDSEVQKIQATGVFFLKDGQALALNHNQGGAKPTEKMQSLVNARTNRMALVYMQLAPLYEVTCGHPLVR